LNSFGGTPSFTRVFPIVPLNAQGRKEYPKIFKGTIIWNLLLGFCKNLGLDEGTKYPLYPFPRNSKYFWDNWTIGRIMIICSNNPFRSFAVKIIFATLKRDF
jgi:hypothetical protein